MLEIFEKGSVERYTNLNHGQDKQGTDQPLPHETQTAKRKGGWMVGLLVGGLPVGFGGLVLVVGLLMVGWWLVWWVGGWFVGWWVGG